MNQNNVRFCRKPEILARVGVSDSTLWRMERDGKFPKRRTIGSGVAGWLSNEIDAWFEKLEENQS